MASWGELLRRIAGIFTVTNATLLAALNSASDDGHLEQLSGDFIKMLGPSNEGKFQVFSFRETRPLANGPLGPLADLVCMLNVLMILARVLIREGCSTQFLQDRFRMGSLLTRP